MIENRKKAEMSDVTIVIIIVIIVILLGLVFFFSKVKMFKSIIGMP